jgi:transcriptional regulator with XRE-family HTH domain
MAELKDWIRDARKARGWTQEKLGEELGVTKANVSGWENARHQPSFDQIVRICELTGAAMPGSGPGVAEPPAAYGTPAEISPLELDVLHALRYLPLEEQQEIAHDVMHRAERLTKAAQDLLARHGMAVTGFASATRAAEHLPKAPPLPPPPAPSPSNVVKLPGFGIDAPPNYTLVPTPWRLVESPVRPKKKDGEE